MKEIFLTPTLLFILLHTPTPTTRETLRWQKEIRLRFMGLEISKHREQWELNNSGPSLEALLEGNSTLPTKAATLQEWPFRTLPNPDQENQWSTEKNSISSKNWLQPIINPEASPAKTTVPKHTGLPMIPDVSLVLVTLDMYILDKWKTQIQYTGSLVTLGDPVSYCHPSWASTCFSEMLNVKVIFICLMQLQSSFLTPSVTTKIIWEDRKGTFLFSEILRSSFKI